VFLMTCFRTPFHEETELLSVLRFPFRVRTPLCNVRGKSRMVLRVRPSPGSGFLHPMFLAMDP
jgi:hypothetical protein